MAISDDLARDAFSYAYSMDAAYTFFYETTVEPGRALNEFQLLRDLADDTYTAHPTINNDTLHLQGWFDVAAEPVVVTIPDHDEGRYWILHTMDLGHYTTAMIGSRTRGTKGGRFLFAGTAWQGEIPDGIDEVIRSDSDLIKVMGRVMTIGGDDLAVARRLQDQWLLQTLSAYLGTEAPAAKERSYPDPAKTDWLDRVSFVLADGSMAAADADWLSKYDAIGLGPGNAEFTSEQREAAERGEELGMAQIAQVAASATGSKNLLGTREQLHSEPRDVFSAGTFIGQWGLPPEESVYSKIETDSDGQPLNGSDGKAYRMRFLPPDVSEFWSYTAYADDNRLMAHNVLHRFSRGDRTLTLGDDGYYTIDLSADCVGNADNPNFLPIPEKDAYLILRLYGPSQEMQDGKYEVPPVTVVS